MVFRQDYLYWKTIEQLVVVHQFRIVQISQNQSEVWLESAKKKGPSLIRLLRYDLDWGNWMKRDMEDTARKVDTVRKKQYKRNLDALNVYVSTYPPVDEWSDRVSEPLVIGSKGQTNLQTVVVHSENVQTTLQSLSALLQVDLAIETEGFLYDYSVIESLKNRVIGVTNQRVKQEKDIFTYGKPYFTYVFIFIQVIMFALLELKGGSTDTENLIAFGAKENFLILQGEWWRFFAPIVLHIGMFHLLMNTMALYFLGTAVERIYGRYRFLLIYLLAGFAGTLASFVFSPSVSAGASGAIFGCFGALLFFGVVHPSLFFRTMGSNVLIVIAINLMIGFIVPVVDNAGHIGGLVGGFIASAVVHLPRQKRYMKRLAALVLTLVLTIGMLYLGFKVQPASGDPRYAVTIAKDHIEAGEINEAYQVLTEVNDKDLQAEYYFYLSYTEFELGKLEEAKKHLEIVTSKLPDLHEGHYNLALVYTELKEYDKAKSSIEQAISLDPDNDDYHSVLEEINDLSEGSE
ncbi:rhomboid family protein [Litchfieldia alkalitelluris]|uniref:rhomboid family protein n=1 Tax=Litchfieldia alkalitelluris TaxID=304268 RepID=UPI0009962CFD|nr:rhomboid family intramembrane serine protease [Litchfieldia alkalitelluris]